MSDARPDPTPTRPILYGAPAPGGAALLPWSWAQTRLVEARNYWIASVRPSGRPHSRPVWGVWLEDGFWFVTASLAQANIVGNPEVTVHLEDGTASLIVEGRAERATDAAQVRRLAEVYNPKYGWTLRPDGEDGGVADANEPLGPALRVVPEVAFGWEPSMQQPTRWRF